MIWQIGIKKLRLKFAVPDVSKDRNHFNPIIFPVEFLKIDYKKHPYKEISIDAFRKIKVLRIRDIEYNVYQIIVWAAHIMGGIHSDAAETKEEKYLENLRELVLGETLPSYEIIKGVCTVTLKAMEPLENAIIGHTSTAGF